MDILPTGITGFHHITEDAPPIVLKRDFTRFCYHLIRMIGAKVVSADKSFCTVQNYYASIILYRKQQYLILCNAHYPFVGISTYLGDDESFHFVDLPFGLESEAYDGFFIVSSQQLQQEPTEDMFKKLNSVEVDQITYWNPAQVGDILYNSWA